LLILNNQPPPLIKAIDKTRYLAWPSRKMRCIHVPWSTSSRPACDIIKDFDLLLQFLFLAVEVPQIEGKVGPKNPTDNAIAPSYFVCSSRTRPYVDLDI